MTGQPVLQFSTPIRQRKVDLIKNGPDSEVKGNIENHEDTIGERRDQVAAVSKKWFRLRDSYGVSIDPGQDEITLLAARWLTKAAEPRKDKD